MKTLISTRKITGLTLIELLIILAILGLLAVLLGPSVLCTTYNGNSRHTASAQIASVENALDAYRLDIYEYPKTLEGLIKNETNDPRWRGPYFQKGRFNDPWGNPYQYQMPGRDGNDYDLFSYGADGQLGGEGESADVVND